MAIIDFNYAEGGKPNADKKGRVMRLVGRTFAEKRQEVIALMTTYKEDLDSRNRGQVMKVLVDLLKNSEEFRTAFTAIAVQKIKARERIKKAAGLVREKGKSAVNKAERGKKYSNAVDPGVLANEIKEVFQTASPVELQAAIDVESKKSQRMNLMYLGAAIFVGWWLWKTKPWK